MKLFVTIFPLLLILTSCGGTSSKPATANDPAKLTTPADLSNTGVGNFTGVYICEKMSWTRTDTDGNATISEKAIRLVIKQTDLKLVLNAWDGLGTTGKQIRSFDNGTTPLFFDKDTRTVKENQYSYKGQIDEKSFEVMTEGFNQPDYTKPPVRYFQKTNFVQTSATTVYFKVQNFNISSDGIDEVYEGDFTLKNN